jgi:hypothetical protein
MVLFLSRWFWSWSLWCRLLPSCGWPFANNMNFQILFCHTFFCIRHHSSRGIGAMSGIAQPGWWFVLIWQLIRSHNRAGFFCLHLHISSGLVNFLCYQLILSTKSPNVTINIIGSIGYPCPVLSHPLLHNNLNIIWLSHWTLQVLTFSHPFPALTFHVLYRPFIVICR